MNRTEEKLKQYGFHSMTHAYNNAVEEVRKRKEGLIRPYKTTWPKFNKQLGGGLQLATTYTIGGRPGIGKSAFTNKLLFDLCELSYMESTIVCYWTWEMPSYQQLIRGFSGDFGKTVQELMDVENPISDELYSQILSSKSKWESFPIYFMSYSKSPDYIYGMLKDIQAANPDMNIINIFDHTRLAAKPEDAYSEEEKIRRLYHCAQQLSVNFGMINIFLSQLNRDIESDSRKKNPVPQLSDFFGADAVAQFSNVAIILQQPIRYRLTEYLKEDTMDLLAVHIVKNRDGAVGWIPFDHDLARNTMKERHALITTPTYSL